MKKLLSAAIFMLMLPMVVFAADYAEFEKDTKQTVLIWKNLLGTTSANKQKESQELVEKAIKAWQPVIKKYADQKPAEFSNIKEFGENLHVIALSLGKAADEIKNNKVLESHDTLEAFRYILWDMRAQADVKRLIDILNDFHEVMELVVEEIEIAEKDELIKIMKRKGVWMRIKAQEIKAFVNKNHGNSKVLKDAAAQLDLSITKLAIATSKKSIDEADVAAHDVKKSFKKLFFNDEVY